MLETECPEEAQHVHLHAVDRATRAGYLDLTYRLGKDFSARQDPGEPATAGGGST